MSQNIIAVVVTFNRKSLLGPALDGILAQTAPVQKIIVIDNASTDGTREMLLDGGYLSNPKIDYFRAEKNLGGAGGFGLGVQRALGSEANWFWLMDDDVRPTADCLARLLEFSNVSECLHPLKFRVDGTEHPWEQNLDIRTARRTVLPNISFRNGKRITFVNVGCFEGMLISRRVVDAIGIPDGKYFISEDDTIYGFKASLHTNVAFVRDAVIHKAIAMKPDTPWKTYYVVRNKAYLYRDAAEFTGAKSRRAIGMLFLFISFWELLFRLSKGPAFFRPAFAGTYDGLRYLFTGNTPNVR